MALVFQRRLAVPLWVFAFFAVALTAPTAAALPLVVVLGIAMLAFTTPGLIAWLRGSPSAAQILSNRSRRTRPATVVVAGACVNPLDTPGRKTAEDALDLVRMDDDGGWQMARPPA